MRRLRRGVVAGASLAAIAFAQGISPWGPVVLAAGNLYVDINSVSCSDTGPGSLTQPYCHISPAATAATAGTSVLVNTGTYLENVTVAHSGSSGSPISFAPNSGQSVTISGQMHGFTVSARSYIVISGFTITSTTGTGINVGTSSNITITGNTVTGTAGAGINVVASSSITVSNNTVTGAGQRLAPTLTQTFTAPGIQLSGTSSSLVTHNTSDNNSDHGILISNGSANNVVSFNEASLNAEGWQRAATGISVTGTGSTGNTLLGNVTHDNEDSGLQFYTGANNGIAVENVSYNNGDHGSDNHNVTGGVITGNDIYHNCTTGINVEGTSGNYFVENNIAVDNAVYAAYKGISCSRGKGNIGIFDSATSSTTVDYNLVNLTSGSAEYAWGPALSITTYSTVAAFHTATGQEAHGLLGDPKWVNPAGADFHLLGGSPAIDSANAGAPSEPSTDIEGKPRVDDPATPNTGAGPRDYDDRGAYEFQPTVSDQQPPSVPTGLAGSASSKPLQVLLSWNPSSDNVGVTGYTVYRGGIVLAEVSGTTYQDTAVVDGSTYTYAVDAFDASGNHSPQSAPVTATPDLTPPSVPTGVTATALSTPQVNVSWNASTDNVGVTGYDIYRNGSSTPLATVDGSTLTYADKSVASLTSYSYTVDAFDAAGNHSAQSAAVIVSTSQIWNSLGGLMGSAMGASSWGSNRVDVFVEGADGGLWQDTWNGSSWGGWTPLYGIITGAPGAVDWSSGRIDVFVRGQDKALWHRSSDGTTWTPWEYLGGGLSYGPTVASWQPQRLDVFVVGLDHQLWHRYFDGTNWGGWEPLGGILTSQPAAVSWGPNQIDIFARGGDGQMWHMSWAGNHWTGWAPMGGLFNYGPAVASCASGHLDVYGVGLDNGLWHNSWNGSTWSGWQPMGGTWTAAPGAVCEPGTSIVQLFERAPDGSGVATPTSGT